MPPTRLLSPVGESEYKREVKDDYEEKLEIKKNKYDYKYENKKLGITERVKITNNEYSYYYKDRTCEEKLDGYLIRGERLNIKVKINQ